MERKLKNIRFLQKYCGLEIREYDHYTREDVKKLYENINNSKTSGKIKKSNKLKIKRAFEKHRMKDPVHIILTAAGKAPPKILLPKFQVNQILPLFLN